MKEGTSMRTMRLSMARITQDHSFQKKISIILSPNFCHKYVHVSNLMTSMNECQQITHSWRNNTVKSTVQRLSIIGSFIKPSNEGQLDGQWVNAATFLASTKYLNQILYQDSRTHHWFGILIAQIPSLSNAFVNWERWLSGLKRQIYKGIIVNYQSWSSVLIPIVI